MASPSERTRNNVRAGVFVSLSLLLCLVVMIVLTDALSAFSRSTDKYTVAFAVASGVANLKAGSDVRVGGVLMGEVNSVAPHLKDGEAFRMIEVQFELDRRITLYADAHVLVSAPIIGSDAWLEIPSVGNPAAGKPLGNRLVGVSSAGVLANLLGNANAGKADEMVENARVFTEFLAHIPVDYEKRIVPALDDVSSIAADLKAVSADVRQTRWPTWANAIDEVMTWAAQATSKLDSAIADGQGLLSDSRAVVAENRPHINAIVGNVQSATNRLNTETIDKFHALLESGQLGLDQAVLAMEDLRVDYAGWATNIGEALANANLAAQQLKLTTIETRRSPWKLLYRPSSDELEHELLYEATRAFAVAAADLKAASQSVQRVLDHHGEKIAGDEQAYRRLEQSLLQSLDNYEKTQQQLLDVLIDDSEPK